MPPGVPAEIPPEESKRCFPAQSVPATRSALRNFRGNTSLHPSGSPSWTEYFSPATGSRDMSPVASNWRRRRGRHYVHRQPEEGTGSSRTARRCTSPEVMDFLKSKFGDHRLSWRTQHHSHSPALYYPDFSFWPQASQEVAERMPETFDELKAIVEGFTRRMDGDQLRRMARHTRRRAELCCAEGMTLRAAPVHHSTVTFAVTSPRRLDSFTNLDTMQYC